MYGLECGLQDHYRLIDMLNSDETGISGCYTMWQACSIKCLWIPSSRLVNSHLTLYWSFWSACERSVQAVGATDDHTSVKEVLRITCKKCVERSRKADTWWFVFLPAYWTVCIIVSMFLHLKLFWAVILYMFSGGQGQKCMIIKIILELSICYRFTKKF